MPHQNWVTFAAGGSYAAPHLSLELHEFAQATVQFDQFAERDPDFGPGKGEISYWAVDQDLAGAPGTFAASALNENSPIPLSPWTRVRDSVSVIEVGRGTSISKKAMTLSAVDLDMKSRKRLQNHLVLILDHGAGTAFKSTAVKYNTTGAASGQWSLTGTPAGASTSNLTAWHFREIYEYMFQTLKVPTWGDSADYIFITRHEGVRALYEDPDFEQVQLYAEPARRLNGEVGRYYHFRIVETNNTAILAMQGTGSVLPESVAFGADGVMKAVAADPIILADSSGDFGRALRLAWWGILQWGLVHQYTTVGDARVVHVTST
jgi:hypothetical protein